MRHDVIKERYARMYEIPNQLAQLGHDIYCVSLSYSSKEEGVFEVPLSCKDEDTILTWRSINFRWFSIVTIVADIYSKLPFKPDLVLAGSDAIHCILAQTLAKRLQCPYWLDLYDNFESFGLTKLPLIHYLYKRSLTNANGISCISKPLEQYIAARYRPKGPVITMVSAVDKALFYPRDKIECRTMLGLPKDAILIGTAGALDYERGIEDLYQAFLMLAGEIDNLYLVLAGVANKHSPVLQHERVIFLGQRPHADIPILFNALDVAVIVMRDTEFGRFCFPQKAYEMLACGTAVISSRVGHMAMILAQSPQFLYSAGESQELKEKLEFLCHDSGGDIKESLEVPAWSELVVSLEKILFSI